MKTDELKSRILKNTTIEDTDTLQESKFFTEKDMIPTMVPAVNVALSGRLDGGFCPGLTMFAGQSKHFKTGFSLLLVQGYMRKYPDAVLLFYDTEFGAPLSYFDTFGIDLSRVVHTPLLDIEQFKMDIMNQLTNIKRNDRVIILVDSIGGLASKKEVDDALKGSTAADMTRAKQIKSLFRMVTPHLMAKNIPMIAVNHTYKTMEMYAKEIVSGGQGAYLAADSIFVMGREQEKDSKTNEFEGFNFKLKVEKSRYVREKSVIPVLVTFEDGIHAHSGLEEWAIESGHLIKENRGKNGTWFIKNGKEYKKSDTDNIEFYHDILADEKFVEFVKNKYSIVSDRTLEDASS